MRIASIVLTLAMVLAAAAASAATNFSIVNVTTSQGNPLSALAIGETVTFGIRLSNSVGIFGLGASAYGYDESVIDFSTGETVASINHAVAIPAVGAFSGLGNTLSNPLSETSIGASGNRVLIFNGVGLTATNTNALDPGLNGVVGGNDAQMRLTFVAMGPGTTQILIGTGYNGDGEVLAGGVTDQSSVTSLQLTVGGTNPGPFPVLLNKNAQTDQGSDIFPQIETDGAGNWIAIWQSSDPLGSSLGSDFDILYTRSSDDGTTWTNPAPLNSTASFDSAQDDWPSLATDGNGNWVAVWRSNVTFGGGTGSDWDILFSRSTNNGVTWSPVFPLSANPLFDTASDQQPYVAADGEAFIVVWESDGGLLGADNDIRMTRSIDGGASWSAPTSLSSDSAFGSTNEIHPTLVTDRAGHWIAAWEARGGPLGEDGDILAARSSNGGVTWTLPAPLNLNATTDTGEDAWPDLATDEFGTWVATWESSESLDGTIGSDRDILFARSSDLGNSWSPPSPLNANAATDSGDDANPDITTDKVGNWTVVWDSADSLGDTIGTDSDVLYSRSLSFGAFWTPPAPLHGNAGVDSGGDFNPRIATRPAGLSVVAWHSSENLFGNVGTDWDLFSMITIPDERDSDLDGALDGDDNCPVDFNPAQEDVDGDLIGDVCDPFPTDVCHGVGLHPKSTASLAANQDNTCEDWSGVSQPGTSLESAVLRKTLLSSANLNGVLFINANLTDADLTGAQLVSAQLRNTNLTRTIFTDANLSFANFLGANLSGTIFTDSNLNFASLTSATYDESTVFPSGNRYDVPPWGLSEGVAPWDAGMIPAPEPSSGSLVWGIVILAGIARRKRFVQ